MVQGRVEGSDGLENSEGLALESGREFAFFESGEGECSGGVPKAFASGGEACLLGGCEVDLLNSEGGHDGSSGRVKHSKFATE